MKRTVPEEKSAVKTSSVSLALTDLIPALKH
jgi:hypothetical protein